MEVCGESRRPPFVPGKTTRECRGGLRRRRIRARLRRRMSKSRLVKREISDVHDRLLQHRYNVTYHLSSSCRPTRLVYICVYICMYVCIYIYIYMYLSLSLYTCIYIYIYMYIHTMNSLGHGAAPGLPESQDPGERPLERGGLYYYCYYHHHYYYH